VYSLDCFSLGGRVTSGEILTSSGEVSRINPLPCASSRCKTTSWCGDGNSKSSFRARCSSLERSTHLLSRNVELFLSLTSFCVVRQVCLVAVSSISVSIWGSRMRNYCQACLLCRYSDCPVSTLMHDVSLYPCAFPSSSSFLSFSENDPNLKLLLAH
jgi:hypothetical protein